MLRIRAMEGAGGLSTLANPSLTQPFVNLCEGFPNANCNRISYRLLRAHPPHFAQRRRMSLQPYHAAHVPSFVASFHYFGDHDSAPGPTLCINTLDRHRIFLVDVAAFPEGAQWPHLIHPRRLLHLLRARDPDSAFPPITQRGTCDYGSLDGLLRQGSTVQYNVPKK